MKIKRIIFEHWSLILYFSLSLFAVLPFFSSGFFVIHDDVQVARIYEMAKSLSAGMFPVRWVQDLGYGYGYPIFNFYSVLPYYIGGGLVQLGFNALLSTKIVFVSGIIMSGVSMYFLAKAYFGKITALASSVIYLYFPYHAVNIYVRGDLAELFAYAFLPLVFLAIFKIHLSDKILKPYIVLGSLSIAAVILSHNLSAFMLFIFIGIFIVYSLVFAKNRKTLFISYASVLVLAFFLSAFYALPAVVEAGYTNVASQVGGGADYRDHFVCLNQLWDSPWGFGGSTKGCVDGLSFRLGKLNVILAFLAILISLISFKKLKENRMVVLTSLIFLAFSIFMTLDYSAFLWKIPYMDFLQYPWRFLNFAALFISFLVGFLIWFVRGKTSQNIAIVLAVLIITSTLFSNGKLFVPQEILDRDSSYYTNEYYLNWIASRISDEYLPKNFTKPLSPQEISDHPLVFPQTHKSLYTLVRAAPHSFTFSFAQTLIEKVSNLLSIIGILALVAVIIGKADPVFYGKKTS